MSGDCGSKKKIACMIVRQEKSDMLAANCNRRHYKKGAVTRVVELRKDDRGGRTRRCAPTRRRVGLWFQMRAWLAREGAHAGAPLREGDCLYGFR